MELAKVNLMMDVNPCCCRVGFMMYYSDRIRQAIDNEKKLEKSGLT